MFAVCVCVCARESSVTLVTGIWTGQSSIQILAGAIDFSLTCPDWLWDPPTQQQHPFQWLP